MTTSSSLRTSSSASRSTWRARGQRQQDVEADRPLAGLDPADGRRTEVGPGGELVERQAERVPQAAQPGAHHLFDLVRLVPSPLTVRSGLANIARPLARSGIERIVGRMSDTRPPHRRAPLRRRRRRRIGRRARRRAPARSPAPLGDRRRRRRAAQRPGRAHAQLPRPRGAAAVGADRDRSRGGPQLRRRGPRRSRAST